MTTDQLNDVCYPIDYSVDVGLIKKSIDQLFIDLQTSKNHFVEEIKKYGFSTLNLTHLKELEGAERWKKYRGNHQAVRAEGVDEKNFSVLLDEITDSYIGKIIKDLQHFHLEKNKTIFQGRCQLIWIGPGRCYPLHVDSHTPDRYHIPVETDPNCWFIFQGKTEVTTVHLPADGRVWYLNPQKQKHTVAHLGHISRLHLLLTNGYHDD
jgi:hypothetical protein